MIIVESYDAADEIFLFIDDRVVQDVLAGRVCVRDGFVANHLVWTDQMEESEDHLQTTESNSLEDRCFLLLIFHIDGVVKDWVVRHCFLDVEAQFHDESEDFVVAVIYA